MIDKNGFILENQLELPFLALDITQAQAATTFSAALDAGYRHFLLAPNGENATALRAMLQGCPLSRRELFFTMELDSIPDAAKLPQAVEGLLQEMDISYLDLLLLRHKDGQLAENWAQMEWLYEIGATQSIGVSGFLPQQLLPLLRTAKLRPMANLLAFSPANAHPVTAAFCLAHGIQMLGRLPRHPQTPAGMEKYGKSPLQLCIRLALQNNILPLLQADTPAEMQAAQAVFDFELLPEDFYALLTMGE